MTFVDNFDTHSAIEVPFGWLLVGPPLLQVVRWFTNVPSIGAAKLRVGLISLAVNLKVIEFVSDLGLGLQRVNFHFSEYSA